MAASPTLLPPRPAWAFVLGGIAVLFGLLTLFSGGQVLFGAAAARTAAGNYIPVIVWFNFLSGFAYVLTGIELMRWRRSGAVLAMGLAAALVLAGAYLALHVAAGGAYEMRTAMAMVLRVCFWTTTAMLACRALGCLNTSSLLDIR